MQTMEYLLYREDNDQVTKLRNSVEQRLIKEIWNCVAMSNKTGQTHTKVQKLARRRTTEGISKIVIAVVVVAVIVIAGGTTLYLTSLSPNPSSNNCSTSNASSPSVVEVVITNGAGSRSGAPGYAPDSVTLVIGVNNTVTWTNNDTDAHTVTSSSAPACGSFNSGNMSHGQIYTHTFTVPGTYQYYCKYHSWMSGTIVVVAAHSSD